MLTRRRHIERWTTVHAVAVSAATAAAVALEAPWIPAVIGTASLGVLLAVGWHRLSPGHVASWANALTGVRLLGVVVLGVVGTAERLESHGVFLAGLGLGLLVLDGLDGYLARRFDHSSALGARFDAAVDALLVLVLASIAYLGGRLGAWVLLAGLLRYGFVLLEPLVRRPGATTARSLRARIVFVVANLALLTPLLPLPGLYRPAAAAATVLLVGSFVVDGWRISSGPEHLARWSEKVRSLIR